ncbi:MAG TPA: hypothetical protein DHU63_03195 [Candidatus Marinimicrobia bacterium]|nr:MAG: hypothetical protein AUJ47_12940 [Candidatus Marinimicrobia bacterium CG1_02_48_14]PIZ69659.1 MAG: hypothetical protein COY19_01525 [Candidatus Marinimicrobia bacterium CG_4_10_14_0_2_um_filter_48_9]PJA54768.1 MAG: hypothetical protein CO167_02025 [Candidatus Marinimicrobia bacterium CG_4_9_14_3_um_filter_48_9]HCW75526.1 hypothetical protein [Candidatus Neomarinimicrobiota bacterium]
METAYFLSDAHLQFHLDDYERLRRLELFKLLDQIRAEGATLFILGDWFDFYFEYGQVITKGYLDVFIKLRELQQAGIAVHYVAGNHDYWLGKWLTEEFGIQIYREPVTLDFAGKQWHLIHGDGLAKADSGYRLLKKFLRHPALIKLFGWIHPDVGHWLANFVSYKSRALNSDETADLEAKVQENILYAHTIFEAGADYFITGHVHWPRIERFSGKTFLTIGDWLNHFSYGYYDGSNLLLKQWPVKSLPQRELP